MAYVVEKPSVLNKFFQNYNILPRSGVRARVLRVRAENFSADAASSCLAVMSWMAGAVSVLQGAVDVHH